MAGVMHIEGPKQELGGGPMGMIDGMLQELYGPSADENPFV